MSDQFPKGTRVQVLGDHAPDAPAPVGTVTSRVGKRLVVQMEHGQHPEEWHIETTALEKVDAKQVKKIVAERDKSLAAYKSAQAKSETKAARTDVSGA